MESPTRLEGGVKRGSSLESLHCRKRHRPDFPKNLWSLTSSFTRQCIQSGKILVTMGLTIKLLFETIHEWFWLHAPDTKGAWTLCISLSFNTNTQFPCCKWHMPAKKDAKKKQLYKQTNKQKAWPIFCFTLIGRMGHKRAGRIAILDQSSILYVIFSFFFHGNHWFIAL